MLDELSVVDGTTVVCDCSQKCNAGVNQHTATATTTTQAVMGTHNLTRDFFATAGFGVGRMEVCSVDSGL
ncbi:MAG TPA: hypothetical protein PLY31_07645, partial [Tenuifilaceae bacterium]|nr:hypothetical protein [Tenuifilaceae bacterium]